MFAASLGIFAIVAIIAFEGYSIAYVVFYNCIALVKLSKDNFRPTHSKLICL